MEAYFNLSLYSGIQQTIIMLTRVKVAIILTIFFFAALTILLIQRDSSNRAAQSSWLNSTELILQSFTDKNLDIGTATEENKFAFVTLCTNVRTVYPLLVLLRQLERIKAKPSATRIVIVPESIKREFGEIISTFTPTGVLLHTYPDTSDLFTIRYEVKNPSTKERDRMLWHKLRAWSLTEYDRIIFLDVDLLLLRNFDELFDAKGTLAGREVAGVPLLDGDEKVVFWRPPRAKILNKGALGPDGKVPLLAYDPNKNDTDDIMEKVTKEDIVAGWTGLNSGVLVLKPSNDRFQQLLASASTLEKRTCCPTQEFIFRFFESAGQYFRLPAIYNARKIHKLPPAEQHILRQHMKIYHFVERKKPYAQSQHALSLSTDPNNRYAQEWWSVAKEVDADLDRMYPVSDSNNHSLVTLLREQAIHENKAY